MPITAERDLYTCNACGKRLPLHRFRDGGRLDSDTGDWICGDCNRCPDCGLSLGDGRRHVHRCRFPILARAIGLGLTPVEKRYVGWLASHDAETVSTLAELFRRVREA